MSQTLFQVVRFDFHDMQIESCPACMCDWIQIHNGGDPTSDKSIGKYCGSAPKAIITTVSDAYLTFHTDPSSAVFRGFKLQYTRFNLSGQSHRSYSLHE